MFSIVEGVTDTKVLAHRDVVSWRATIRPVPYLETMRHAALTIVMVFILACAVCAEDKSRTPIPFTLTGTTVQVIDGGDYVHPALSQDGTQVAYSAVVVKDVCEEGSCAKTELTEILVKNLRTGRIRKLLSDEQSKKYMVYKAYVVGLKWTSGTRLEATIRDGDVDLQRLVFRFPSGEILEDRPILHPDDANSPPAKLLDSAFPSEKWQWRNHSLIGSPVKWDGQSYLVLTMHPGWTIDSSDWTQRLMLLRENQRPQLIAETIGKGKYLCGGEKYATGFLVGICEYGSDLQLALISGAAVTRRWTVPAGSHFESIGELNDGLLFSAFTDVHARRNPIYLLRKGTLYVTSDEIVEASVSKAANLVAVLVWRENQRHIEIRRLIPMPAEKKAR